MLLALPGLLGSECRLSLGSVDLPVREIVVVPSVVELRVGGLAAVEAIGRDQLGGRVDVRVSWEPADPDVAAVAPPFGSRTVITGVGAGETSVVATHERSGARDTVLVTVSPAVAGKRTRTAPRHVTHRAEPPRRRGRDLSSGRSGRIGAEGG